MSVAVARYNPTRVVVVTLGLSAAGAVFGGLAGATALGVGLLLSSGLQPFQDLWVLNLPAIIGAALGAVCAPVAGWLLLREVPLGRAFRGLTIGTVLGGVAGWLLPLRSNPFIGPILSAGLGFLVAAVLMRVRRRRARGPAGLVPGAPPN